MQGSFLRRLRNQGLAHVAQQVQHLVLPSIRLSTKLMDDDLIPVGASKFGGMPDLPDELGWPDWAGRRLRFLMQLNMRDVAPYDREHLLPSSGMLYLFDSFDDPYAYSKTFYYDVHASSLERYYPLDTSPTHECLYTRKISFDVEYTLPYWLLNLECYYQDFHVVYWDIYAQDIPKLDSHERVIFQRVLHQHCLDMNDDQPMHRLLGHPDEFQGESNPGIPDEADAWRLLFQIDTDSSLNINWSLSGRAFYWIRRDALRARDFRSIERIVQCT